MLLLGGGPLRWDQIELLNYVEVVVFAVVRRLLDFLQSTICDPLSLGQRRGLTRLIDIQRSALMVYSRICSLDVDLELVSLNSLLLGEVK